MESLAEDLRTMVRRPLQPAHVLTLQQNGSLRDIPAGTIVLQAGDRLNDFNYLM